MSTLKPNKKINLNIHGIGSNGEGVGYYHGYTVFVDGALPGENVAARLFQCKKSYGRANLLIIDQPSADRVSPICPLFGECGGCQVMHMSYPKQLEIKKQRVIDAMQRIGKIDDVEVLPCLPSPSSLGYRNKIQIHVKENDNGLSLGFYARSSHDLVEVNRCYIHCPLGEQVYKETIEIVKKSGIRAYNPETGTGILRHILIKSSENTQEVLVVLVTGKEDLPLLSQIAEEIMTRCPCVKGVVQNLHSENDNVILGGTYKVLAGSPYITEQLCGMNFKVSPASFFQVNPDQAQCLYAKALEFAELKGDETVLDAYCGVGTLSLLFARHAKKVIGVECVPEAIADANENAVMNNCSNVSFVCANSEEFIETLSESEIDVVILNPPRKGCELSFLKGLERLRPKRVVYISCDPATLARDLYHLRSFGFDIEAIQPFDMFPQTAHVETVVKANLRSNP